MKNIRTSFRIPTPRTEDTPAAALRRLLAERSARRMAELRRRLADKR